MHSDMPMDDPLSGFNWSSLYARYDATCRGFDATSIYLSVFESKRPDSDRQLYYELIRLLAPDNRFSSSQPIRVYEALLYWKLYSQHVTPSNLWRWLRQDIEARRRSEESLRRLLKSLPDDLEKDPNEILSAISLLGTFHIPGMGKAPSAALPVRTTFLHFLYPNVVPILDQMVLKATGLWQRNANQRRDVFKKYLPVAWRLAERYKTEISAFYQETPVRAVDMALWIVRNCG